MLDATLTIKNFRCFNDEHPVQLHLKSGVTAFVGPNNAGKSSLLRMFFELRDLFNRVEGDPGARQAWLGGGRSGFNLAGFPDPLGMFHDGNARPMSLRLDCAASEDNSSVSGIEFLFHRSDPAAPSATFFQGKKYRTVTSQSVSGWASNYLAHIGNEKLDFENLAMVARICRDTLYIGPFRNILNQSKAQYYDLTVGTDFVVRWDQWKNGSDRSQNRAIKEIEYSIARLFGFSSLEINPAPGNEELRVFVDGHPFALHE